LKVGVFGGSFNPVHHAHLAVAEAARKTFSLDRVLFVPAAVPPHKRREKLASDRDRLAMLRLALEGREAFEADDLELRRGGVSYTVDTIEELRRRFPPGTEFFFILGSDSLPILPQWKEVHQLLAAVRFAVYPRKGFASSILDGLAGRFSEEEIQSLRSGFLDLPPVDISATEVRERLRRGEAVDHLVPRPVAEYLRTHGLVL